MTDNRHRIKEVPGLGFKLFRMRKAELRRKDSCWVSYIQKFALIGLERTHGGNGEDGDTSTAGPRIGHTDCFLCVSTCYIFVVCVYVLFWCQLEHVSFQYCRKLDCCNAWAFGKLKTGVIIRKEWMQWIGCVPVLGTCIF